MPSRVWAGVVAIPLALLGVLQLVWHPTSETEAAKTATDNALALTAGDLPEQIGPWRRESFETVEREAFNDFGRYSRSYIYRHTTKDGVAANVSLDFPYVGGWHDLCVCYRNSGWKLSERSVVDDAAPADGKWGYVEGDLEGITGDPALVMFAGFTVDGAKAEPPSQLVLWRYWFRLRRKLLEHTASQLMQVQVFAQGDASHRQEVKGDIKQLFDVVREEFRDKVVTGAAPVTDS